MKYCTVSMLIVSTMLAFIFPIYAINYPFTTIDTSGFYKLASNVVNQITISVSNVTLDMNGCTVSGGANGIVVNSGLSNVTIRNGTVHGVNDGILINAECKDIILKEVTVQNCVRGFHLDAISDAIIRDCDMILNTTGMHINTSHNIMVKNCVAHANVQAGYSLLTSTTCTFIDCKALSTGDANPNSFGDASNIFGFVSHSGIGTVFERCIANSTQALTTTNANSLIAGFALRGIEKCSKIIECEASNGTTSPTGVAIPYGILLEARFDGLVSVTSTNPDAGGTSDTVSSVAWSPDGLYVAIGGTISGITNSDVFMYKFDRQAGDLVQTASLAPQGLLNDQINTVDWSPDSHYLAVGGATSINSLFIYRFDTVAGTLENIISLNVSGGAAGDDLVNSVDWSPDGNFLAVGGNISGGTNNDVFVFQFDRVVETLTQVVTVNPGGGSSTDEIFGVAWSPNGRYLAVGGNISGTSNNDLFVYRFDRSNGFFLTQVASVNPVATTDVVTSVAWSFDGNYLAITRQQGGGSNSTLFIYRFNKTAETLTPVDQSDPVGNGGTSQTVKWSPDGSYLAVGSVGGTNSLFIYSFNRSLESLTKLQSVNPDGGSSDTVFSVDWSPDGGYLAVGGTINGSTNNDFFVYRALQFPENNVISGNMVYCNTGNKYQGGVGISGSSIVNLIIDNSAFSNPFNYQFVCNVFNQLFGEGPSALQNIAVQANNPIATPDDIPTRIKRTNLLLESLIDNLL